MSAVQSRTILHDVSGVILERRSISGLNLQMASDLKRVEAEFGMQIDREVRQREPVAA